MAHYCVYCMAMTWQRNKIYKLIKAEFQGYHRQAGHSIIWNIALWFHIIIGISQYGCKLKDVIDNLAAF